MDHLARHFPTSQKCGRFSIIGLNCHVTQSGLLCLETQVFITVQEVEMSSSLDVGEIFIGLFFCCSHSHMAM